MKKILQKSLCRLHALLLLAVMFVVGGSAWADSVTFTASDLIGKTSVTKGDVTITFSSSVGSWNNYAEPAGGTTWTVTGDGKLITSITVNGYGGYVKFVANGTGITGGGGTNTWNAPEPVATVNCECKDNGSSKEMDITNIVIGVIEDPNSSKSYTDFTHSSQNGGAKGFYTLNSDVITFNSPVTVKSAPKFNGNEVTSAVVDGNNLNITFPEVDKPGTYNLVFAKGSLQIGDDYNNEFSITYTLAQDPNKLYTTFNFNGAGIHYTNEGIGKTLNSGDGLNTGDVFTSDNVQLTFTNANKNIAWSNMAQRLYLGQGTTFSITAPTGYELVKLVFITDNGYVQLGGPSGLTYAGYTTQTWTGQAEKLDFRASYDTKVQTIDVVCTKLADVEYEVDIYKGTEQADDDWTVTVNGVDGTFKNMDTFTTGKNIQPTDVVAPHHDGYHEAEVDIKEMAGTMFITVTYEVFDPINYTIDFSDNAPVGATVTIDDQEFTGDDTYSVAKDLDYYSVTAVDAPAGWYADYSYNEGNHTFTFDFKQYINYSVVVEGAPAGQGGVVYNYVTYGAGDNVINAKTALTENSVSVADVDGYAGTVSLDDHTFTVSYKKETIVFIPVNEYNSTVEPVSAYIPHLDNGYAELYGDGEYAWISLSSATHYIVKVAMECTPNSWTDGSHASTLGSYVYEAEDLGVMQPDGNSVVWTGKSKSVKFISDVYNDFNVTSIKVWVEEAEVEPRENVMALTAKAPNLVGNVNEVTSTISFDANVNTEGNHHGYDGSSTDVPDGVTMKDASGNNYTITAMRWWDNQGQVSISLEHGITTPGDYTLTIPEGVIPCVGNKANVEQTFTWHVLTPAPAFPLQTVAYEVKSVADDKFVTLDETGLALDEVAEGFTFTWSKNDEAFIVKDKDENRLGGDTEFWTVESLGNDTYAFVSKSAGTYMSVDGETVVLNANDAYAFTLNVWVDPALFGAPASAVALDESGLYVGTYYADHAWTTEDAWVYVVTGIGANSQLQTQMVSGTVPANTGVLLYSPTQNSNIAIRKSAEEVAPIEGNLLNGTVEATDGVGGDGATYYVLSKREGKLGFYWDPRTQDEGATLNNGAHKAYLRIPAAQGGSSNAYYFRFDEGTLTGIDAVVADETEAIFNLQGKRVARENLPAGIYVKNGRKFIVK